MWEGADVCAIQAGRGSVYFLKKKIWIYKISEAREAGLRAIKNARMSARSTQSQTSQTLRCHGNNKQLDSVTQSVWHAERECFQPPAYRMTSIQPSHWNSHFVFSIAQDTSWPSPGQAGQSKPIFGQTVDTSKQFLGVSENVFSSYWTSSYFCSTVNVLYNYRKRAKELADTFLTLQHWAELLSLTNKRLSKFIKLISSLVKQSLCVRAGIYD